MRPIPHLLGSVPLVCIGICSSRAMQYWYKILCTHPAPRRNRSGKLAPYDMKPPATTFSRCWNSPGSRLFARKLMIRLTWSW